MEGSPVSPVHRFKETNIRPQILVCSSSCSIYETTAILYLPKLGRCTDAKFLFESMSQLASASTAIEAAFKLLEQTVSDDHKRDFYSTELKDVRQAALDIEKWQRSRKITKKYGPYRTTPRRYPTVCRSTRNTVSGYSISSLYMGEL